VTEYWKSFAKDVLWKTIKRAFGYSILGGCACPSGVTSKPASRGHFKTGQLSASRTAIFLPYRQ